MDRAFPPAPHVVAPLAARRTPAKPVDRQRPLLRGAWLLACVDSLAAVVAIVTVWVSANLSSIPADMSGFLSARVTIKNLLLIIALSTTWPVVFRLFGLYEARRVRRFRSEAKRLVAATAVGASLGFLFPLTSDTGSLTLWSVPYFWLSSLGLCLLVRGGRRAVDRARHRQGRRALIVGTGPLARRADRDISLDRLHRYEVVGFVDDGGNGGPRTDLGERVIGTLDHLEQLLMREVIDEVIIALPIKSCYEQIQTVIGVCERAGIQAKYDANMFQSTVAFPRYDADSYRSFVAMQVVPDGYRLVVKRGVDILGASVGVLIFAPLMLIVAAAIKLTSPGPVIYAQNRCGLSKRGFRMYKFRSMRVDADTLQDSLEERNEASGPVFKIRDDPRITPLGRVLRQMSLDELPQLWNVLRGDMSLVGPRPLPWRDVQRITQPSDMRRFSMRPGITCLWQIQGRNNLHFDRWVELDVEYIDTWSLSLDTRILIKTIPAVLSGNGAA